uniref:DUF4912 domain-containing protein n=1 Tax=Anisakis simplex TaxID=6269 RepID=A0A0M3KGV0_ANISI
LTDQFEGRFVVLALSANGLALYWKQWESDAQQRLSEAIYVDEIVDVYAGCCTETVKQKVRQQRVMNALFDGPSKLSVQCTFYHQCVPA